MAKTTTNIFTIHSVQKHSCETPNHQWCQTVYKPDPYKAHSGL